MSKSRRKKLANRKRRIQYRLRDRNWSSQDRPMLTASHIHYDLSGRIRGLGVGGAGVMHRLALQTGLIAAIDLDRIVAGRGDRMLGATLYSRVGLKYNLTQRCTERGEPLYTMDDVQRFFGSLKLFVYRSSEPVHLSRDALHWLWAVACLTADDCDEGGLTEDALAWLLAVARPRGRAAWYLAAASTGLRKSDLAGLTWADIDFGEGSIRVRFGKAMRKDIIPLHTELAEELQRIRPSTAHPHARVFTTVMANRTRRKDFLRAGLAYEEYVTDEDGEMQAQAQTQDPN